MYATGTTAAACAAASPGESAATIIVAPRTRPAAATPYHAIPAEIACVTAIHTAIAQGYYLEPPLDVS